MPWQQKKKTKGNASATVTSTTTSDEEFLHAVVQDPARKDRFRLYSWKTGKKTWTFNCLLPEEFDDFSAIARFRGSRAITGGRTALKKFWILMDNRRCHEGPPLPKGRFGHGMIEARDNLIVVGGCVPNTEHREVVAAELAPGQAREQTPGREMPHEVREQVGKPPGSPGNRLSSEDVAQTGSSSETMTKELLGELSLHCSIYAFSRESLENDLGQEDFPERATENPGHDCGATGMERTVESSGQSEQGESFPIPMSPDDKTEKDSENTGYVSAFAREILKHLPVPNLGPEENSTKKHRDSVTQSASSQLLEKAFAPDIYPASEESEERSPQVHGTGKGMFEDLHSIPPRCAVITGNLSNRDESSETLNDSVLEHLRRSWETSYLLQDSLETPPEPPGFIQEYEENAGKSLESGSLSALILRSVDASISNRGLMGEVSEKKGSSLSSKPSEPTKDTSVKQDTASQTGELNVSTRPGSSEVRKSQQGTHPLEPDFREADGAARVLVKTDSLGKPYTIRASQEQFDREFPRIVQRDARERNLINADPLSRTRRQDGPPSKLKQDNSLEDDGYLTEGMKANPLVSSSDILEGGSLGYREWPQVTRKRNMEAGKSNDGRARAGQGWSIQAPRCSRPGPARDSPGGPNAHSHPANAAQTPKDDGESVERGDLTSAANSSGSTSQPSAGRGDGRATDHSPRVPEWISTASVISWKNRKNWQSLGQLVKAVGHCSVARVEKLILIIGQEHPESRSLVVQTFNLETEAAVLLDCSLPRIVEAPHYVGSGRSAVFFVHRDGTLISFRLRDKTFVRGKDVVLQNFEEEPTRWVSKKRDYLGVIGGSVYKIDVWDMKTELSPDKQCFIPRIFSHLKIVKIVNN